MRLEYSLKQPTPSFPAVYENAASSESVLGYDYQVARGRLRMEQMAANLPSNATKSGQSEPILVRVDLDERNVFSRFKIMESEFLNSHIAIVQRFQRADSAKRHKFSQVTYDDTHYCKPS
jgi:hypothetical protein